MSAADGLLLDTVDEGAFAQQCAGHRDELEALRHGQVHRGTLGDAAQQHQRQVQHGAELAGTVEQERLRRERPHPGARLRFTDIDGHRPTCSVTGTRHGQLADLLRVPPTVVREFLNLGSPGGG
jgi:hypothetical protein